VFSLLLLSLDVFAIYSDQGFGPFNSAYLINAQRGGKWDSFLGSDKMTGWGHEDADWIGHAGEGGSFDNFLLLGDPSGFAIAACLNIHVDGVSFDDNWRNSLMFGNDDQFHVSANAEIDQPQWHFDRCGDPLDNSTWTELDVDPRCDVFGDFSSWWAMDYDTEQTPGEDPSYINYNYCKSCLIVPLFVEWRLGIPISNKHLFGDVMQSDLHYSVYFVQKQSDPIADDPFTTNDLGDIVNTNFGVSPEDTWDGGWGVPQTSIESHNLDPKDLIFVSDPEGVPYACSYLSDNERNEEVYDPILDICTISPGGTSDGFAAAYIPAKYWKSVDYVVVEGRMGGDVFAYPFPVVSNVHVPSEQVLQEMCDDDGSPSVCEGIYLESETADGSSSSSTNYGGSALARTETFGPTTSE